MGVLRRGSSSLWRCLHSAPQHALTKLVVWKLNIIIMMTDWQPPRPPAEKMLHGELGCLRQ